VGASKDDIIIGGKGHDRFWILDGFDSIDGQDGFDYLETLSLANSGTGISLIYDKASEVLRLGRLDTSFAMRR
jgi:Ca2+-binding RTX toxin-like protein